MPTTSRREKALLQIFLSAYENASFRIVETMFYDHDGLLRFELYRDAHVIRSLDFQDGQQLFKEFVDTTPVPEGGTQ